MTILSCLAWFVITNVPRYLVVTPESYGGYFWPKVSWLLPHVASGLLAILIGPLQFWPRIRRDYLQFHRIAGRVYVVTALAGSVAAFGLASSVEAGDAAYAMGLSGLALAWIVTTTMAFVAIRRKILAQHKQWMIRSYVVAFAFVTFRLAEDLMSATNIMPGHERSSVLAWGCWAIPLLFTEVAIQASAVFKRRG
ncbi:MAG TPA: DUF2306 domain-containing protein [Opitutaceae bacterium]